MSDPFGSTSVPQEHVQVGRELMRLNTLIPAFVAKIVPGAVLPGEWSAMADELEGLVARCRELDVVIEPQGVVIDGSVDTGPQPHTEPLRPAAPAPHRLPFSNSGP